MVVKLRKALQIKNRLTGEIGQLSKLIQQNNLYRDGKSRFDVNQLMKERSAKVEQLINLKTEISKANVAIYAKMAQMEELKAQIQLYRGLNTDDGEREVGYGEYAKTHIMIAYITAQQVENKVAELTKQIEDLQDQIDYYNGTTDITLDDQY